jgi:DNA-binding response OmpR family regulator
LSKDPDVESALKEEVAVEGHTAIRTTDAGTAFSLAGKSIFDLIILDADPSTEDGLQHFRELRRRNPGALIMLLTDGHRPELKDSQIDPDDYLSRPFTPLVMRARVTALLRRKTSRQPNLHRFGPFQVDLDRLEVRESDRVVSLTPEEFRLLATFLYHRGETLSCRQLVERVWGRDRSVTESVVAAQVSALRKKIETDFSNPRYLVSVGEAGYRFDG